MLTDWYQIWPELASEDADTASVPPPDLWPHLSSPPPPLLLSSGCRVGIWLRLVPLLFGESHVSRLKAEDAAFRIPSACSAHCERRAEASGRSRTAGLMRCVNSASMGEFTCMHARKQRRASFHHTLRSLSISARGLWARGAAVAGGPVRPALTVLGLLVSLVPRCFTPGLSTFLQTWVHVVLFTVEPTQVLHLHKTPLPPQTRAPVMGNRPFSLLKFSNSFGTEFKRWKDYKWSLAYRRKTEVKISKQT